MNHPNKRIPISKHNKMHIENMRHKEKKVNTKNKTKQKEKYTTSIPTDVVFFYFTFWLKHTTPVIPGNRCSTTLLHQLC